MILFDMIGDEEVIAEWPPMNKPFSERHVIESPQEMDIEEVVDYLNTTYRGYEND